MSVPRETDKINQIIRKLEKDGEEIGEGGKAGEKQQQSQSDRMIKS